MEIEDDKNPRFPIDIKQLDKLTKTHPHTEICPVCGNKSWYVMQDDTGRIAVLGQANAKVGNMPDGGYLLIALCCQKCGFLRSHIKVILDAYLSSLPDEA